MKRSERLKILRDIIKNNKIASQEQLISHLSGRGFKVTQSTVSRDIQFLNLVKIRDAEQNEYYSIKNKYMDNPQFTIEKIKAKFEENVISIERANNIIIIKTNPGEAQGVAVAIDGSNFDKILGTVAGDDTILCVIASNPDAEKIHALFESL